ncbi:MAG: hypothetical protein WBJ54_00125 [Syntrophorhabdus sp.]|nr:hypothetical protein [Pseudomonadota bacterium]
MLKIVRFFIVSATASMLLLGFTLTAAIADMHYCTPHSVAVYAVKPNQRIHVRCTEPAPGTDYIYFAYYGAKKFSPDSDRFLNLITFAMQNSKTLAIQFDPSDQSGSKIGCLTHDCRLIQSLHVY